MRLATVILTALPARGWLSRSDALTLNQAEMWQYLAAIAEHNNDD